MKNLLTLLICKSLLNMCSELKDILKEIDNTKRNIAGLDRLIPKYYESKIKKILEKLNENKYKLKSSKGKLTYFIV